METGSVRGPRTWPPDQVTAAGSASSKSGSAVVQKVLPVGHRGGLATRADAELAEDVGHVHAGRLGRDEELGGDVTVAAAGGHQAQHLEFAFGEPERCRLVGWPSLSRPGGQADAGPPGQRADLLEQGARAKTAGQVGRAAEPDGCAVPVRGPRTLPVTIL